MTEINKEIDEIEQSFDRLQELIEKHQLGKNNLFGIKSVSDLGKRLDAMEQTTKEINSLLKKIKIKSFVLQREFNLNDQQKELLNKVDEVVNSCNL